MKTWFRELTSSKFSIQPLPKNVRGKFKRLIEEEESVGPYKNEEYFNGLMNYENSVALFFNKETSNDVTKYVGKIKTFDALVTKTNMTLNVNAKHLYCKQSNKTYPVFRFSPKEFGVNVWKKLEKVKLRGKVCDI